MIIMVYSIGVSRTISFHYESEPGKPVVENASVLQSIAGPVALPE